MSLRTDTRRPLVLTRPGDPARTEPRITSDDSLTLALGYLALSIRREWKAGLCMAVIAVCLIIAGSIFA